MRIFYAVLIALAFPVVLLAQVKTVEPPVPKIPFTQSLQVLVVTTKDWSAVQGTARVFERKTPNSKWTPSGVSFPVVVGRSGLAWGESTFIQGTPPKSKKEGDGNAPAGMFPLTTAFGSSSKPNGVEMSYTKLDEFTECVDDVESFHYNKIVNRMHVGNFDWKSSEKMLAVGEQYDLGVFVGYNSFPVEKAKGSCIFLHIWKDANSGTSGCTAMERRNLEVIISRFVPAKNPYLVQMPDAIYDRYRKSWNLPKLK